jgi:hypothetical protein
MRVSKFLATVAAAAAMIAVSVAALPGHAEAWVVYRGGAQVWVPGPVVVAPPAYAYAPPAYYYAPPQPYYVQPQHVWVPAHYEGPYFVPGHWA